VSAPSRLSSLLVRDGLVGVKRMEQAFQRQVIYGGTLDTILLEMGAVPEDKLTEYLSLATGLPSAHRELVEYFDPQAAQVCPRALAEQFHVAPVAFDDDAVRVLVTDPVDLPALEDLATQLGLPIQPFVVPEYRFQVILERIFGVLLAPRYAALATRAAQLSGRPFGPEPKVVIAADVDPAQIAAYTPEPEADPSDETGNPFDEEPSEGAAEIAARASYTLPYHSVVSASPAPVSSVSSESYDEMEVSRAAESTPAIAAEEPLLGPAPPVAKASWRGGGVLVDPSPLEPREAAALLADASDRDAVFAALIRGVRSRTRYAACLVVQGGIAYGRMAIDGYDADAAEIGHVSFDVFEADAFAQCAQGRSPYIGPVATGEPELDAALARMGGQVPASALLLPVVIKDRVVALVYAHRGEESLSIAEVAEVLPLAGEASLALSRLILRLKAAGYRKVSGNGAHVAAPGLSVDEVPVKSAMTAATGGWARAEAEGSAIDPVAHAAAVETHRPMRELVDAVEAAAEDGASDDALDALSRPEELLAELRGRFPGRLWIDRYEASGRAARASQYGPLLALLVRLGSRAAPLLNEHMSSADREIRFYATLACREVRSPLLVPGLVARLFDPDYGVRAAALDALLGYPFTDVESSLDVVRRALHADAAKSRAAAHALGELRDVRAIPDLIDATDRDHTTAEEARRALVKLTKQDFHTKAKKWRAWWEKNKQRPRIEWMLDGLASSEDEVRLSASEELKRLTGEYFGYHYDLPRREREEARLRWLKWWEDTGRRRFLGEGREERNRPTALLPNVPRR
jgi:HEAT repeat protein